MTALVKRVVDGWSVTMDGDEPRILDVELGTRLGFARPVKIRDLIKRLARLGKLKDVRSVTAVGRQQTRSGAVREFAVNEFWLTEAQALKVIAKSETEVADQILDEVIGVFMAVRRGQLPVPQQVAVLSSSPLLGDSQLRTEFAARCSTAAAKLGVGIHRIHGAVRQQLRVVGIYQLPVVLYVHARELVDAWTARRLPLPAASRRRATSRAGTAAPAQTSLPLGERRR